MEWDEVLTARFELVSERIRLITKENTIKEPFGDYFQKTAAFIVQLLEASEKLGLLFPDGTKWWQEKSEEELIGLNKTLYFDVLCEHYEKSYANPRYAAEKLGEEFGALCAAVYTDIRNGIHDIFEGRLDFFTARMELFVEIYNMFEGGIPKYDEVRDAFYWFMSDYSDTMYAHTAVSGIVPEKSFENTIISDNIDFSDLRYLYRFGYYVSKSVRETAGFINSLSEAEIDAIARTYTEGYRRGFELGNKDLSKKKTVQLRFCPGFERIVKKSAGLFYDMGLKPTYRISSKVNEQYSYDHRYDAGLYLDKAFVERRLSVLRSVYDTYKEAAGVYAGPAVIETFGEAPFVPENKSECVKLNEKQRKLYLRYVSRQREIMNEYVPADETSFTIIAFPIPDIGEHFREIFEETVRVNTLDIDEYCKVQQTIVDALDKSSYVRIKGRDNNRTDLRVNLIKLENPSKETKFENCLADVNIPLGEVFTSPCLKGTDGILHACEVYLNDLKYIDFQVEFKDGCVVDYTCANFSEEAENKAYIKENVLMSHETLPMGEFAIGTNTVAYRMAQKYDIVYKMPILIVEKMGPHFAVGDTCYSHSEGVRVYNPDGKEIVAKENDFSLLRNENPEKAYFNCHTDITIPYHELGEIALYDEADNKTLLIENGRFVLQGTGLLNKALDE